MVCGTNRGIITTIFFFVIFFVVSSCLSAAGTPLYTTTPSPHPSMHTCSSLYITPLPIHYSLNTPLPLCSCPPLLISPPLLNISPRFPALVVAMQWVWSMGTCICQGATTCNELSMMSGGLLCRIV